MSLTLAKTWCPQSRTRCWPIRLGGSSRAQCPECGRLLRPVLDALDDAVLPHHLPEKPRRGR
jgi:hypothetical protein